MEAIETAIRNAFEKGDARDPDYRRRVYRSAIAAMEKALQANQGLSADVAARRREAVRATVDQIESEFVPAARAETEPPPVSAERRYASADLPEPPLVEAETRVHRAAPYAEPRVEADFPRDRQEGGAGGLGGVNERIIRPARRGGGLLARLLPVVIVILAAGAALWWAASSGLFRDPEVARDQSEAPAGGPALPQGPAGEPLLPGSGGSQDWITVFSPDDPTQVSAPPNASAEIAEDESGRFMRIRSGSDGLPVRFRVGQGILERITGRSAVFDIVARAEEGTPTEIAVECDFGALGDCGRRRYQVNYERGEFLFEVRLPKGQPSAGGTIAIAPDVENAGKAVDIYEIRVSASE